MAAPELHSICFPLYRYFVPYFQPEVKGRKGTVYYWCSNLLGAGLGGRKFLFYFQYDRIYMAICTWLSGALYQPYDDSAGARG